jgi:methionyl-tRNA synthetase
MDEPTPTTATIQYDDFAKLDLRVGTVKECSVVEKSKKLLLLQVELGNGEMRTIFAGIREHYAPDQLIGKQIVVVANLAPRPMFGGFSQGMLLAAGDETTGKVVVVSPSEVVTPGSKVR